MKIFITGGSGMLGQYLNLELHKKHEILTQYYSNPGNCTNFPNVCLDLTNFEQLKKVFNEFNPDIVIHAAAVSTPEKVDEQSSKFVYNLNVNTTAKIAELCKVSSSRMIYTSTDLVYAGYRGSFLKEDSKLIPSSLYAETKLMGEAKIKEVFDNYLILRVSLQIGFGLNHSTNNFHKLYNSLKENKSFKLYTDQFRTPLALHESAKMISSLTEMDIVSETLNFGGKERVSRYELGEILCEEGGFDKNLLIPTTMAEVNLKYPVADVSLKTTKLSSFGINIEPLRNSIRTLLKENE